MKYEFVHELMTLNPVSIRPTDTIHKAKQQMDEMAIRHLPVTCERMKLLGLITNRSLLSFFHSTVVGVTVGFQENVNKSVSVSKIMQTILVVVTQYDTLDFAATKLFSNKIGCLPVVDKNRKLIGILTEADFLLPFVL